MVRKITLGDFKERLAAHNRSSPVTILAITEAAARKNPFGKIYKLAKVNGFIGNNYEANVRTQEIREGHLPPQFNVSPRSWGSRTGKCLVRNGNDNFYLAIRPIKVIHSPVYYVEKEGKLQRVKKEMVAQYLIKPKAPNQGLNKPVLYRNYKLENIKKIRMMGEILKIV